MRKLLFAAASFVLLMPTFPAQADTFFGTPVCSGGGGSLSCTFTANAGFLFIDSNAVNMNVSGTVTGATETWSGGSGAVTSSVVDFSGPQNVDGLGLFNVTDRLISGMGGNPTASMVTINLTGTALALLANAKGFDFSAHICAVSSGSDCSSTFFAPPGEVVTSPIPGALPLFATGLVLTGWLMRRRRQRGELQQLGAA